MRTLAVWTCAVLLTGVSRAQNFKYATIRWRQEAVVPPTVRFQITTAWRRSAFSEARTGCQADCANVAGGLLCAKGCSGTSPSGGMAPAVGDSVSFYDVYSSSAGGPANKGVPLVFDFGDAAPSLTGERVAVPVGTAERPEAKCRSIGNPSFGLCLEGRVQDVEEATDTVVVQSDFIRVYPNPGVFVAFFQGCCRPDNLVNNANSAWKLSSTVVISSSLPNESPAIALTPTVRKKCTHARTHARTHTHTHCKYIALTPRALQYR